MVPWCNQISKKGYSVAYITHFYRYQCSYSVCLEEINNLEFKIITAVVFVTLSHPAVSVIANSRKARSSVPSTSHAKVACVGVMAMKA